jgi:predicted Fe-S protein YdhL (DUF1289 family)
MSADPPSPCNGVCRIEQPSGHCAGCARTMDEIAGWPAMSAQEKRRVLARLPQRKGQ